MEAKSSWPKINVNGITASLPGPEGQIKRARLNSSIEKEIIISRFDIITAAVF